MVLPAWPTELPRPNRDGYSERPVDARLRKPTDQGPGSQRLGYSAVPIGVNVALDVTLDQRGRFERFHVEETVRGTLPFMMPDPARDGVPLLAAPGVPLLDAAGEPILIAAPRLCRFGEGTPQYGHLRGIRWRIQFALEVLP